MDQNFESVLLHKIIVASGVFFFTVSKVVGVSSDEKKRLTFPGVANVSVKDTL